MNARDDYALNVDGAANRRQLFKGESRDNYMKQNVSLSDLEPSEDDVFSKNRGNPRDAN